MERRVFAIHYRVFCMRYRVWGISRRVVRYPISSLLYPVSTLLYAASPMGNGRTGLLNGELDIVYGTGDTAYRPGDTTYGTGDTRYGLEGYNVSPLALSLGWFVKSAGATRKTFSQVIADGFSVWQPGVCGHFDAAIENQSGLIRLAACQQQGVFQISQQRR